MGGTISWQDFGDVIIDLKGRAKVSHVPPEPGLYRIISESGWAYVGHGGSLRKRVKEYHRPTAHNEHEHRLHRLIRQNRCKLQIAIGEQFATESARRAYEAAAMLSAKGEGFMLWNLSQNKKSDQIKMLISYHEGMLLELNELLAKETAK